MNTSQIILLVAAIFLIQALIWFVVFRWVKMKTEALKSKMIAQCNRMSERTVIGPKSAIYRGADARFGNIKGNGIICLTENALFFEKLTGQKIDIARADIAKVTVETSFKGKTSFATGGKHLVIKTRDGNRIGFLLKGAEEWSAIFNS
jgi:hypothetical protein